MNKVIAIFEMEGFTQKNYDDIMNELEASGGIKEAARPSHTSFKKEGIWCVIDVWDSQEALMEFAQNRLFPIFGKLGLIPPRPQIYPVHNFVDAGKEQFTSV